MRAARAPGDVVVAAAAAVAVTGEREQDTWISLRTTLLTPGEIVLAKQFGAAWAARWLGLAILAVGGLGLLVGAIHPLGVAVAASWRRSAAGSSPRWACSSPAGPATRPCAVLSTLIALIVGAGYLPTHAPGVARLVSRGHRPVARREPAPV